MKAFIKKEKKAKSMVLPTIDLKDYMDSVSSLKVAPVKQQVSHQ